MEGMGGTGPEPSAGDSRQERRPDRKLCPQFHVKGARVGRRGLGGSTGSSTAWAEKKLGRHCKDGAEQVASLSPPAMGGHSLPILPPSHCVKRMSQGWRLEGPHLKLQLPLPQFPVAVPGDAEDVRPPDPTAQDGVARPASFMDGPVVTSERPRTFFQAVAKLKFVITFEQGALCLIFAWAREFCRWNCLVPRKPQDGLPFYGWGRDGENRDLPSACSSLEGAPQESLTPAAVGLAGALRAQTFLQAAHLPGVASRTTEPSSPAALI